MIENYGHYEKWNLATLSKSFQGVSVKCTHWRDKNAYQSQQMVCQISVKGTLLGQPVDIEMQTGTQSTRSTQNLAAYKVIGKLEELYPNIGINFRSLSRESRRLRLTTFANEDTHLQKIGFK